MMKKLFKAVDDGDANRVKALLNTCGELVDERRDDIRNGNTPLTWAAWKGHAEVVKLLLAKNASTDLQDMNGETALLLAADKGHAKVVELLLAKNASTDLQTKNGDTALLLAAMNGHTEVVELLLAKNASTDLQTENGDTALTLAADKVIRRWWSCC